MLWVQSPLVAARGADHYLLAVIALHVGIGGVLSVARLKRGRLELAAVLDIPGSPPPPVGRLPPDPVDHAEPGPDRQRPSRSGTLGLYA